MDFFFFNHYTLNFGKRTCESHQWSCSYQDSQSQIFLYFTNLWITVFKVVRFSDSLLNGKNNT